MDEKEFYRRFDEIAGELDTSSIPGDVEKPSIYLFSEEGIVAIDGIFTLEQLERIIVLLKEQRAVAA